LLKYLFLCYYSSLRRSFNSALANAGVAEEIRMKLTGHSSKAMNDRYTHLLVAALRNAVTALPLFGASADSSGDAANPQPARNRRRRDPYQNSLSSG